MFVGLDVHKATIAVAVAEGGHREAARYFGEIENTSAALSKLAKKYSRSNVRLSFCYEAGPCGYGVHRHLIGLGHECLVVAPSLLSVRCSRRRSPARTMTPTYRSDLSRRLGCRPREVSF